MKIFGLAGWSGSGKTTLITRMLPILTGQGVRVSTLKHAHHHFDMDQPGKDSYRHRRAGAREVMVSSARRWALVHELAADESEYSLARLTGYFSDTDLLLVEGYKRAPHPKLEVYREQNHKPLLCPDDPHIVALASDISPGDISAPDISPGDSPGHIPNHSPGHSPGHRRKKDGVDTDGGKETPDHFLKNITIPHFSLDRVEDICRFILSFNRITAKGRTRGPTK